MDITSIVEAVGGIALPLASGFMLYINAKFSRLEKNIDRLTGEIKDSASSVSEELKSDFNVIASNLEKRVISLESDASSYYKYSYQLLGETKLTTTKLQGQDKILALRITQLEKYLEKHSGFAIREHPGEDYEDGGSDQ